MAILNKALDYTLQALEIQPDNSTAYLNLRGIYKDLGLLDEALSSTLKSLKIQPDNPKVYLNIGAIYKEIGDLDKALAFTLKSLQFNPADPDNYLNLGTIYKDLGQIDRSIESILKSLELKPENPSAFMNLGIAFEALNLLESSLKNYTKSANLIIKVAEEDCLTSLICAIIIRIQLNQIKEASQSINQAKQIASSKHKIFKSITKNRKTNDAYINYLGKLIPLIPDLNLDIKSRIIHLGESHCLAFTNQLVRINSQYSIVKPSLIKGAKAFHLTKKKTKNVQQIAFERRVMNENLAEYEYIFISFGEIDCRADEGILPYCHKYGKSIEEITQKTVEEFYAWTFQLLSKYKNKLIYFGVPAPSRSNLDQDKEFSKEDIDRLHIIQFFNSKLKEKCIKSQVLFADVYSLTSGVDGFNNRKWMIDSNHLKPSALHELVNSININ